MKVGRIQQRFGQREPRIVLCGHLHQRFATIDRVAGRRDVPVAFAEAGGDDRAEMRSDLETELAAEGRRQRSDPAIDAVIQVDRSISARALRHPASRVAVRTGSWRRRRESR